MTKTDIYFELQNWIDGMKNFNDLQYGKAKIKALQSNVMSDLLDEKSCDGSYFFNDKEVWELPGTMTPVSVHTRTERKALPALGRSEDQTKWLVGFKRPQSGFVLVRYSVPTEEVAVAVL